MGPGQRSTAVCVSAIRTAFMEAGAEKDLIPVMKWFIVPKDETGHAFDRDKSVF
jgi:hypothetical protein